MRAEWHAFRAGMAKEWQAMRRYPLQLVFPAVWAVLLPAVYLAQATGFTGGDPDAVTAFAERSGTRDVAGFLYLGWSVQLWLSIVLWGPGAAIYEEKARGVLEVVFLSRTSAFSLLFARTPVYLVPGLCVFAATLAVLRATGTPVGPAQVLTALLVILCSVPVIFALSGLVASVSLWLRDVDGLIEVVRGVFLLLCGVAYPLAVLPGWARALGHALPPTHVIDALRVGVLSPVGVSGVAWQIVWLLVAAALVGAVAVAAMRSGLARARRDGRLTQF